MNTLVVDIDMTIADNMARAKILTNQNMPSSQRWGHFFNSVGIMKDTLIPGAEFLNELLPTEEVIFITGRPERTRGATLDWLTSNYSNFNPDTHQLIMKVDGDFGPTSIWKADELEALLGKDKPFLFIDDDIENQDEVSERFPLATVLNPPEAWTQLKELYQADSGFDESETSEGDEEYDA